VRRRRVLFAACVSAVLLVGFCLPPLLAGRAADVRRQSFELINQGVTAYKNGDYASAVDQLQQAASMALNNFRAHFYLGLALIGDRRYADALEALGIALELDPDHLQSLVALGDAHLKLGDLDEASAAYFRALKFRPEYAAALDGLARIAEAGAEDEEAIGLFERAIASNRGFAPAYTHLGDLYLRSGRFEEAVRLLEEAVEVRPDFAAGLNRLALAYGRLGLVNEAIAAIRRALEIEPNRAAHPATLGQLQLEQGSLSAAEESFRSALALDESEPRARWGMAEVARRRGEFDAAIEQVDRALEDPRTDALIAGRLRAYREELVEEQQTVQRLAAAIDSGEATSDDYALAALLYAERNRWQEASEMQRRVDPGRDQRERLAYMLFKANRFREAHQIYSELARSTDSATHAINDGVALAMLGDDDEAIEMYRRALEREPDNLTATLFLGNALLRRGDYDGAVTHYRRFLDRAESGERTERVRRILQQVAPETLEQPQREPMAPPPVQDLGQEDAS
jgi:tetratricopeptide (TPR) repeat protein